MKQRDKKKRNPETSHEPQRKAAHDHLCGVGADDDGRGHNCICGG